VPAECLCEHAAGQQPERAAGDGHEHVGAHRAGPLACLRELGDDDREDHRGLRRGTDALQEAGGDQRPLRGRDAAQKRGRSEDRQADEEDALTPGQVTEAAGEEQQAPERDQERVDDPC
jgi:hypothetical protein